MPEQDQQAWLNEPVELTVGNLRLSADAMRALKKATGRSMTDLIQDDDDEANRFQVMAFAKLFSRGAKLGHLPDAATLWEAAGAVDIEFEDEGPIDPLGGASSTTSPPSADTGA